MIGPTDCVGSSCLRTSELPSRLLRSRGERQFIERRAGLALLVRLASARLGQSVDAHNTARGNGLRPEKPIVLAQPPRSLSRLVHRGKPGRRPAEGHSAGRPAGSPGGQDGAARRRCLVADAPVSAGASIEATPEPPPNSEDPLVVEIGPAGTGPLHALASQQTPVRLGYRLGQLACRNLLYSPPPCVGGGCSASGRSLSTSSTSPRRMGAWRCTAIRTTHG
jgi:hypothetical protein